jgi:hypothetical protein
MVVAARKASKCSIWSHSVCVFFFLLSYACNAEHVLWCVIQRHCFSLLPVNISTNQWQRRVCLTVLHTQGIAASRRIITCIETGRRKRNKKKTVKILLKMPKDDVLSGTFYKDNSMRNSIWFCKLNMALADHPVALCWLYNFMLH